MKVYCCQLDIAWENKAENFKRVTTLLRKQRLWRGSLLILPEMFATGFSMNAKAIAESAVGATDRFLRALAREHGVFVIGGLVRSASDGRFFNAAVCLAPDGRRVASYAKLHLFSPGGESRHYAPGLAITLFQWAKYKVAVSICYDLRFPELYRMAVQQAANVLVVIANWPAPRHFHWQALLRARAIENQAYVVGVNRCGADAQLAYQGGSMVVGPGGETVAEAGKKETVLAANLDLAGLNRLRADFPALRDIRTRYRLAGASRQGN
jgi:predicted amidohydrolase